MRRLFRSFEHARLRYLLISGQASVLYGAATFSEDIDIWIEPTAPNVRRLLRALASLNARVYKLTPPMTRENMLSGHGFHFLVPGQPLPIFLDVMGKPPRVGTFAPALRRARRMNVEGQTIPVVAQEDLVKLKLTQRFADYEVISRLVRLRVDEATSARARKRILTWAIANGFRAEDRLAWLQEIGGPKSMRSVEKAISRDVAAHQRRDRIYWRTRIAALRVFFREGTLLPRGMPVADLL